MGLFPKGSRGVAWRDAMEERQRETLCSVISFQHNKYQTCLGHSAQFHLEAFCRKVPASDAVKPPLDKIWETNIFLDNLLQSLDSPYGHKNLLSKLLVVVIESKLSIVNCS